MASYIIRARPEERVVVDVSGGIPGIKASKKLPNAKPSAGKMRLALRVGRP